MRELTRREAKACVGPGWAVIIDRIMDALDAEATKGNKIHIEQVKEKFGGLRFYVASAPDHIHELIEMMEDESYKTCETCGTKADVTVEGGWVKTLCKTCRGGKK